MDPLEITQQVYEEGQKGVLVMWTIYDRPTDHPTGFIARRHDVGRGKSTPTQHSITGDLDKLRVLFRNAGLTRITRHPEDEAQIVECWI